MSHSRAGHALVSLVGAGPGDPDLITVAGRERIREADVIVYDRLIDPVLLSEAVAGAELIYVGKEAGAHSVSQDEIGALLVDRAGKGQRVVRLKGGDPFVFGRGGEEAEALAAAGLGFEVVPGVTSAVAVPAYAGIPVTHRAAASSFAVVTGHEDDAKTEPTIDWGRVAQGADTLVVLMGLRALPGIAARLIEEGRSPDTPAASIQSGTTHRQRVVRATLATLADAVVEARLESPVLTVVGEVVRLGESLDWYGQGPLFGRSVLVTRTRAQASDLVRQLRRLGAEPLEFPTIEIAPVDPVPVRAAVARLAHGSYDWCVFTSTNGVAEWFRFLAEAGLDARAFAGARIAAIGAETARALATHGLRADVVPGRFVAESLLEALAGEELQGKRVLLARADDSRAVLPDGLGAQGAVVDDIPLYIAKRPAQADPEIVRRLREGTVEIATFSSSSTVRGCIELLGGRELLRGVRIVCIGPITAETARAAGLEVALVSEIHTIDGMIDALQEQLRQPEGAPVHAGD
ncbi:MAG: uroporphyrinogen-III C-methyltransferase [Chloroflexi bacterium]|nr:uroporphyrinogen-III C-methyltransferase [Chloroflexota bacterium]